MRDSHILTWCFDDGNNLLCLQRELEDGQDLGDAHADHESQRHRLHVQKELVRLVLLIHSDCGLFDS